MPNYHLNTIFEKKNENHAEFLRLPVFDLIVK